MSRWLPNRQSRVDPWWDLEGPAARDTRRRSRFRRIEASLAWLAVGAMSALSIAGPHAIRLAFLH